MNSPRHHDIHFVDILKNQKLHPTDEDGVALAESGVGPLRGVAVKVVRRFGQMMVERRYLVGHMFYTPGFSEWHFIDFDQRDTESVRRNQWNGGPHIHFVNWLWPRLDAVTVWRNFVTTNEPPGGALHVRYDDAPPPEILELEERYRTEQPQLLAGDSLVP
jgi:hypothetical protein